MRRKVLAAACTLVVVGGLSACGGTEKRAEPSPATTAPAIAIKDFTFAPPTFRARVGDRVEVRNGDTSTHTVTADDKSFDTGNIDGGKSGAFTVGQAGTFKYHCNIHTYMTGTVEVS